MDNALIYWDTSNIFISAKEVAAEREGESARARVRIHFRNLLTVAHANRPVLRAFAVGSIPPELRTVWNRLENEGVSIQLLERWSMGGGEQGVDEALQVATLSDALDYNGDPGIAVLLTGDGSGFAEGRGFHANLERMHRRGWRIEVLSWRRSCNRGMREWAKPTARSSPLTTTTSTSRSWSVQPQASRSPMSATRSRFPPAPCCGVRRSKGWPGVRYSARAPRGSGRPRDAWPTLLAA